MLGPLLGVPAWIPGGCFQAGNVSFVSSRAPAHSPHPSWAWLQCAGARRGGGPSPERSTCSIEKPLHHLQAKVRGGGASRRLEGVSRGLASRDFSSGSPDILSLGVGALPFQAVALTLDNRPDLVRRVTVCETAALEMKCFPCLQPCLPARHQGASLPASKRPSGLQA